MNQSEALSIYIHIPFCKQKCKYCDFLSAPASDRVQEEYLHALLGEMIAQAGQYSHRVVHSIYIGGGTPSVVEPNWICHILKTLFSNFTVAENAEISMELNPGTVTKESLNAYHRAGINRISIGLQSAHDKELALLGRIHGFEDFLTTYRLVREAGFQNVNVDIMAALPGQKVEDYEDTLQKLMALNPIPEHISAYSLIIEEGTPFFSLYGEEKEALEKTGETQKHLPSEAEERRMYEVTAKILSDKGYHQYEISNYSLEGFECYHNKVYWLRGDYVGFGLGAASLVNNIRYRNHADLGAYLREKDKVMECTPLSVKEQMEEFMFLGLRLLNGVDKKEFYHYFHVSMDEVYGQIIEENEKEGLLQNGERVVLTNRGRDISNYVMAQFLVEDF
ncbi:MAG: oxygen-independent coproporphyrinogen III oxidase [Lachnospiraceae bacterium]|nr:oxygen-independent coproporphyrinogen III oxidase [Lachnospiraceae bacterium]